MAMAGKNNRAVDVIEVHFLNELNGRNVTKEPFEPKLIYLNHIRQI